MDYQGDRVKPSKKEKKVEARSFWDEQNESMQKGGLEEDYKHRENWRDWFEEQRQL